jgi:hypothetical protein
MEADVNDDVRMAATGTRHKNGREPRFSGC